MLVKSLSSLLPSLGEVYSCWRLGVVGVVFGWTRLVRYLCYQLDFLPFDDVGVDHR